MELHTPERGADESFADYRLRRSLSRKVVHALTHPQNRGDMVLHRASTAKRNRRERMKALGGVRQFKKWERMARAEAAQ